MSAPRVQLLPEHVANQIAAGEVVERPASVVKELVENALDAGATRIEVETQAGGRGLIRVSDNGQGMSREDALTALKRHATSKISDVSDLSTLRTMGFRGEALPSIASVTRFTLTTCEEGAPDGPGTKALVDGGRVVEVAEAGRAAGTTIEARQLFFNVPARRKFLRKVETEKAHIQQTVTLFALAHPSVGFRLQQDARQVFQIPPQNEPDVGAGQLKNLRHRLEELPGVGSLEVAMDWEGTLDAGKATTALRIWGYISPPGDTRGGRGEQLFFVNQRPVQGKPLSQGLEGGYGEALAKGRYPRCALFLELDPDAIDVNIHPAKREIKFFHERGIQEVMATAVREALESWAQPTQDSTPNPSEPPKPTLQYLTPNRQRTLPMEVRDAPTTKRVIPEWRPNHGPEEPLPNVPDTATPPAPAPRPAPQPILAPTAAPPKPLQLDDLRLIGDLGSRYALFETANGLVLLDVQAARERILYERLLSEMQEGDAPSQRLLLPETIELAPRDMALITENLDTLRQMGFGLGEFGPRTLLLDALPTSAAKVEPGAYLLDLLDQLRETGAKTRNKLSAQAVAQAVCEKTAKRLPPLQDQEPWALLQSLKNCKMPYTCPNGAATIEEIRYAELARRFRG